MQKIIKLISLTFAILSVMALGGCKSAVKDTESVISDEVSMVESVYSDTVSDVESMISSDTVSDDSGIADNDTNMTESSDNVSSN